MDSRLSRQLVKWKSVLALREVLRILTIIPPFGLELLTRNF